jgi:hypothetical protein
MTVSAESNRPTLVKPRSTWVITTKDSPTNPIESLDQVYTHPWSTLGQRHGQTRLNHWRRRMSSGTFAAFSKFSPKHLKIYQYESCPVCWGTQLYVDWHFKFWVEISEKCGQPTVSPVHRNRATFEVWQQIVQNPSRKTLYDLCKSCRG